MEKEAGYDTAVYVIVCITAIQGILVGNWALTFYQLWKKAQTRAISIRRPKSVLFFGVLIFFTLAIWNPLEFMVSINADIYDPLYPLQHFNLHVTRIGIVYTLVYRLWMVYYDIKWLQALEDEEWQSQINTSTLKPSWYIKHRRRYGNPKYVSFFLFTIWAIFCVFGFVSSLISGRSKGSLGIAYISFLGINLSVIVIACKMPKWKDYYRLAQEIKILSVICIIGLILLFVGMFIFFAEIGEIAWIVLQLVGMFIFFSFGAISFFYVFRIFKFPSFICTVNKYISDDSLKLVKIISDELKMDQYKHLGDILKDDELFKLFARHLSKEWAIENLLFIVETNQFIKYVKTLLPVNEQKQEESNKDNTKNDIDNIELAKSVPQSTIIKELNEQLNKEELENNKNAVNIAAINLFMKYIDSVNAYYLINIGSNTRSNLEEVFGYRKITNNEKSNDQMNEYMINNNITLKDICTIWDESRLEIFSLLMSSFRRFKST